MSKKKIYVLASIPNQGKTTTALLLEKQLRSEGLKIACLQSIKGPSDVDLYLKNKCYHYSIPLEAVKNKEAFEMWLPTGYDAYILEITRAYSPIGAAYVSLFQCFNEIISYEVRNNWKKFVFNYNPRFKTFWDEIHDRSVQSVITRTPKCLDLPCVSTDLALHHMDLFATDTVEPMMSIPKSSQIVIAVGAFPAEYWDFFPQLRWYGYDYSSFMKRYRTEDYDIAIIGESFNEKMRFKYIPKKAIVICYQPSLYLNVTKRSSELPVKSEYCNVYSKLKNGSAGIKIGEKDCLYEAYNNRFWLYKPYEDLDILEEKKGIVFCNGWILPQYLIKEDYMEA